MKNSQSKVLGTEKRGLQIVPCSARTIDHCQEEEHICLFIQPTLQAGMGFNIQHRYQALATHGDFFCSQWGETGTGRRQFIQPAFDNFPDGINLSLQRLLFPQLPWGTYKSSFRIKIFQCKIVIAKCIVYIYIPFLFYEWHSKSPNMQEEYWKT